MSYCSITSYINKKIKNKKLIMNYFQKTKTDVFYYYNIIIVKIVFICLFVYLFTSKICTLTDFKITQSCNNITLVFDNFFN